MRKGISEWIEDWVSRGWRTRSKEPVKNQDLWRVLYRLTQAHDVTWEWVAGHSGHPLNERVDRLATEAREALARGPGAPDVHQATDDDRPAVEAYVRASNRGASRPGGWGVVLRMGEHTRSLSGTEPETTANAMLIRGATEALNALTRPCRVIVYSNADYLVKGGSRWVQGWQARGWQTRGGKSVANRAEWEALLEAMEPHDVTWLLVQGDDMPADLELAGELAAQAIPE
jgi:ribonuclease HI